MSIEEVVEAVGGPARTAPAIPPTRFRDRSREPAAMKGPTWLVELWHGC
ncbi:hypothetical protein GWI34_03955 [Actinomadura sp. DSM 109109]|nr:hypothetical protein [Actinomadura lepetitiana]